MRKAAFMLVVIVNVAGCARLPKGTPRLMRLNNERLANLSAVNNRNTVFLVDQLSMIRGDIAEIEASLGGLSDPNCLSEDDRKIIQSVRQEITAAREDIDQTLTPSLKAFPAESYGTANEILVQYQMIADIVQGLVDKKHLLADLVERAQARSDNRKENTDE